MEAVKLMLSVFSRQQKMRLAPFVVTAIFFLVQPYPQLSVLGVIFKAIPIYCLIGYVIISRSQLLKTKNYSLEGVMPTDAYSCLVLVGLAISSVGDFFLAVPALIVPGAVFFIIAHLAYILAIEVDGRHRGSSSGCTWLFVLLFLNTFMCTQTTSQSYFFSFLIFLYFVPLFLAGWKAASALEENPHDKAVMFACVGAALFILSDFVCIASHNGYPVPFAEHIFMITYYGAQFGWAVSTSHFN